MLESLRARLLLWYTAILAIVMVAAGATTCYVTWRSRVAAIDAMLTARVDSLAGALRPAGEGTFDLALNTVTGIVPGAPTAPYHVLWTTRGQLIDRSDPDRDIPQPAESGTRTRDGHREVSRITSSGAVVLAGVTLAEIERDLWSLAGTIASVGGVALALSLAGGWWLVSRALAPVDRIGRTARAMVDGDFTARIPIARVETEFGQLARSLNDAFDRLHDSLERQRRFTADASHELRTPLATLSTEVQWALARPRETLEYRHSLETSQRAARRMQAVVERLLALARDEAGADVDQALTLRLLDLVRRVADDLAPLAQARRLTVTVDGDPLTVTGDPDRLIAAITNVLANAVQYNVDGGQVTIAVRRSADDAEVVVADTGAGISAEDLPRVFDPFFRADPARQHDPGGAGLGLSVARAILRRHGGDVTIASEPGRGTTVVMRLPRVETADGETATPASAR